MLPNKLFSRRSFIQSALGLTIGFLIPGMFRRLKYLNNIIYYLNPTVTGSSSKIPVIGTGDYGEHVVSMAQNLPLTNLRLYSDILSFQKDEGYFNLAFVITGADDYFAGTNFPEVVKSCNEKGLITTTLIMYDFRRIPVIKDRFNAWGNTVSANCDSMIGIRQSTKSFTEFLKTLDNILGTKRLLINGGIQTPAVFFKDAGELKFDSGLGRGENALEQAIPNVLEKLMPGNPKRMLVHFIVGKDCPTLHIYRAAEIVFEQTGNKVDILFVVTIDRGYQNKASVNVIAGKYQNKPIPWKRLGQFPI